MGYVLRFWRRGRAEDTRQTTEDRWQWAEGRRMCERTESFRDLTVYKKAFDLQQPTTGWIPAALLSTYQQKSIRDCSSCAKKLAGCSAKR